LGFVTNYLLPVTSKTEGNYGYARMSQLLIGLRLEHEDELLGHLALFESAEGGVHETIITSHALPPNHGHRPHAWTGYVQTGVGARYALGRGWALIAQVSLVIPFQRSPVLVGDEVIAQAAGPALLNQAGVAVAF
jgi:hypothetical protein